MKRFLFIPPLRLGAGFVLILIFTFILSSIGYGLSADLILDEAMKEALKNNPDILIAKDKVKQAELKVKEAKRIFTPNISIHGGYNVMTNREGVGFQISQDLDRILGGNKREKDNAKLELDIAQKQLILTEQRLIQEVTDAYFNLQLAKDNLKLKENIFDSRYKSLEFAQVKFDLGKLSMDELLSKRKEVEEARFELREARQKVKKAELNLSQLIGEAK